MTHTLRTYRTRTYCTCCESLLHRERGSHYVVCYNANCDTYKQSLDPDSHRALCAEEQVIAEQSRDGQAKRDV